MAFNMYISTKKVSIQIDYNLYAATTDNAISHSINRQHKAEQIRNVESIKGTTSN